MANHLGPVIAERDGLRVVECRECGYAHLAEFPKSGDLERLYSYEFWEKDKAGELALYEDRREWWATTHADWLSRIEQVTLGRTLLDVGCGYGFFINTATERGWGCTGLEPSKSAFEYFMSHKHPETMAANGSWEVDKLHVEFDAISALWLIEHLPNPFEFLRWCRKHLYSGGALLIVCPNEWTRAQADANARVKKQYWWIDKTHLNYFNMATLGNLLGRSGFQVVEWMATDPIEFFINDLYAEDGNYVDNPELGPKLHAEIEEWELKMTQTDRLDRAIQRARRGEGRDIVAIAIVDA